MFILCIDFPCSLPINMERTVLTPGIVSSYVMANREQLWPLLSQQLPQGIAELFPLTSFIPGANFDPILYIGLNYAIASKDLFMHGEGESTLSSILLSLSVSVSASLSAYLPLHLLWKTKTDQMYKTCQKCKHRSHTLLNQMPLEGEI